MDGPRRDTVCLLLLLVVGGATSLKSLKIAVPERVRVGDSALLTCNYELENMMLYATKWYLDDSEFYSYVPKKKPAITTFPVKGISVNVSASNQYEVTLVNVRRKHTGWYKCEVTEDSMQYDTGTQEAFLLVVDVPETEPKIAVDRQHLQAGDTLRANCTTGAARPAPNITWTLNGAPLNQSTMRFKMNTHTTPSGRHDNKTLTHSTLTVYDTRNLFRDGRIYLRCFAEVKPVYNAKDLMIITEDGPNIASITGDASPHSRQTGNGSSELQSTIFWTFGLPTMTVVLSLMSGAISRR